MLVSLRRAYRVVFLALFLFPLVVTGAGRFAATRGVVPLGGFSRRCGVQGGRCLQFQTHIHNDKVLTSVARLMGINAAGFGDDQNCGPVPGLV